MFYQLSYISVHFDANFTVEKITESKINGNWIMTHLKKTTVFMNKFKINYFFNYITEYSTFCVISSYVIKSIQ